MTYYIDSNSYYLLRFFNCKELKYKSLWLFYNHEDGIQMGDFFPDRKVYSFFMGICQYRYFNKNR